MSDDGSTRTGFGAGYGADSTQTIASRKIQVRMPSGKIYGPYLRKEILVFIEEKRVQGEEFILIEGDSEWRPITSDTEFFDALQLKIFGTDPLPAKKSGFTEAKSPSRGKPGGAQGVQKSDTRLTDFSEKSGNSLPRHPASKTKAPVGAASANAKLEKPGSPVAAVDPALAAATAKKPEPPAGWAGVTKPATGLQTPTLSGAARKKPKYVLFAVIAAAAFGATIVLVEPAKPNVSAPRSFGSFQGSSWYSRPLQLVMEGLQIKVQPMPQKIVATSDWDLPEDFGAQAWAEDLRRLLASTDGAYKISSGYWGRWAWNTLWLGSVLEVSDHKLGTALSRDGQQIFEELKKRHLVTPQYDALFTGSVLFTQGKFKEAAAILAPVQDLEIGQWLAEEAAWQAFWQAGARGSGYRRLRDEYQSPTLDLSSKVRASFMTRESKDFNESLLQLSSQAPLINTLWFGAAEGNWRLRKDGAPFANKMFLTGLGTLSLSPASVQEVYWNQYAEFLGVFGRQATAQKAMANALTVASGNVEKLAQNKTWWDLNSAELDVTSLAEEVLASSSKATLNPRDMATLYVLGFVAPNGPKYLTVAAEHWAFEGKWTKAAGLFRNVAKLDPHNAEALGGLVWASANLYQFGEAFDAHDKFAATGVQTPEGTKYLGLIQSIGREYANAEKSFSDYLKSVPNDGFGHFFRAQNFLKEDRNVDCVKASNLARIHATGELKLRANLLFYRCRVLAHMDIKGALSELEDMSKANPDSVPVALEYILALKNANLFDRALEYNRQTLSRYSRSFELRMMLGELYESRSDYDRAVAFYSRARQDQPESAEPVVRIGKIFEMQKKYVQAAQNFETASRIQPDFPEVWLYAARAYRQAKQLDKATQMYIQEIEARPTVIASFIEASEFMLESGAPQEVPKLFQKFKDDFQDDPRVKTRLAQAYLALNDLERARENASAAMATNNKIPEPYRVLGFVFEQQAQYEEAGKYFQTYLELLPQAADAAEIRAKISRPPYHP